MQVKDFSVDVDIFFRAKNLLSKDMLSNPFVVLKDSTGSILGKTETVVDNLSPEFCTAVRVKYCFETFQIMTVEVLDFGEGNQQESFGSATFTMGKLMGSRGNSVTLKMEGKGSITLTGCEVKCDVCDYISFGFEGVDLKKMDTFGKSDPYFHIRRIVPNGCKQYHHSEVVFKTLNPVWKVTPLLNVADLCGGDRDSQCIIFSCFDKDTFFDDPMGDCLLSLNELLHHNHENTTFVIKDKKESYGQIGVPTAKIVHQHSFVEYLNAGMQLNINISIDMTASNLDPKDPKSLHHHDPDFLPNEYIRALLAVSNVVQEYDTDKQFPCFGFGALMPDQKLEYYGQQIGNHFFNLDLGAPTPYIGGMQAVIDTYVQTVNAVTLYGPTNFAPTIQNVTAAARQQLEQGVYSILLILTDGEITDIQQTIDAIVDADDAPLSILIVGVGEANFASMQFLDADGRSLAHSSGRLSRRDIVQFVAFRDFATRSTEELAGELLREVPGQVAKWGVINEMTPEEFSKRVPRPL